LEIGLKFATLAESREGFLRSGVTEANLKEAGKIPSAKDRFAGLAMIALKVSEQFFMVDVGIKSTGDDFGGILSIIVRTSSSVTGNR
jgi:hypothetical protein